MADWTEQDPNTLLPGEPWTSAKALAAFENPVAVVTGGAGAPRQRYLIDEWSTGSGTQIFALPDQYTGAQIFTRAAATAGLGVELSTDGSTFAAVTEIFPDGTGGAGIAFCDFHNGGYIAQHSNIGHDVGTFAGASTSVTHIRLSKLGTGDLGVIIHWNGGAV